MGRLYPLLNPPQAPTAADAYAYFADGQSCVHVHGPDQGGGPQQVRDDHRALVRSDRGQIRVWAILPAEMHKDLSMQARLGFRPERWADEADYAVAQYIAPAARQWGMTCWSAQVIRPEHLDRICEDVPKDPSHVAPQIVLLAAGGVVIRSGGYDQDWIRRLATLSPGDNGDRVFVATWFHDAR